MGLVRWLLFVVGVALVLPAVQAATFGCEIRSESECLPNQTLLLRMNSSEAGAAPNNSHAQLANISALVANFSLCCWTDSFRTLTSACTADSTRVLGLTSTNNSHVQVGTNASYAWSACLNVTAGSIACEYPVGACSAGYSLVASMASSEPADENLTNAHIASPGYYARNVCCSIGGQTPPTVASANIAPINTTRRQDLSCTNGTTLDADDDLVTLHYNWYVNGTSITVLNLPMDYDDTAAANNTHDISGHRNHGTVSGATFVPTSGAVGGAFDFDGANDHVLVGNDSELLFGAGPFSVAMWVLIGAPQTRQLLDKKNGTGVHAGYGVYLAGGAVRFIVADGATSAIAAGTGISNDVWTHVVALRNASGMFVYQQGTLAGSTSSGASLDTSGPIVLTLGANASLLDAYFDGRVDEIMLFNRSLDPAEIQTLYALGNAQLNRSELNRNDTWNCSITPVDSTGLNGSTVFSNRTFVFGSTPRNVSLTYPANGNTSVFERFVNFSWTSADEPDGDLVNYTLNSSVAPGPCSAQAAIQHILTTNRTYGELCTDQIYTWNVTACDTHEGCSNVSLAFNFTIASVLRMTLANDNTNFRDLFAGQSDTTDDYNVTPFLVRNDGNVFFNATIVGNNSPFVQAALGTSAFQYRAEDNETGSINATGSQTLYTPVTDAFTHAIRGLNYSDASDTAAIHINVTVPGDEPPGAKRANLTFRAETS